MIDPTIGGSPEDISRMQQADHLHRPKGVAPEPVVTARPRSIAPTNSELSLSERIGEYPIQIVPHVRVFVSAVENDVTDIARQVQTVNIDGADQNLYAPLNKGGIARTAMQAFVTFMSTVGGTQNIIAGTEEQAREYLEKYVANLQKQLADHFQGELLEDQSHSWSIDLADLFTTSVQIDYERSRGPAQQTVNIVHVTASVAVQCANLLDENGIAEVKPISISLRNMRDATGVDVEMAVVFDVANFKDNPYALSLFTALITEEGSNVKCEDVAGVTGAKSIPGANIVIGVQLPNRNPAVPKKKARK